MGYLEAFLNFLNVASPEARRNLLWSFPQRGTEPEHLRVLIPAVCASGSGRIVSL